MNKKTIIPLIIIAIISLSCSNNKNHDKPNIILIMADDMGYECLSIYGSLSYSTPVLDSLASNGMRFSNCVSQPLCTPSRVKIMTGLYNYRNYEYFGYLNSNQYTFGNLMKEAGYATCIAGKWQLNGLAYKKKILDWADKTRPYKFGFDEYCLWQLTVGGNQGGRFANPTIEENGEFLALSENDYGPDIFANFILDFIERKKDEPFFIYYPMVLVHDPFVPTPDSDDWDDKSKRFKNDKSYFGDMVSYTDKIVGRISDKLEEENLDDKTILIFTGDNGTHFSISSNTSQGIIQGAKGNTIDAGTHVPLIIYWPQEIKKGQVFDGLIEFSDFFTSFADIAGSDLESDGLSFVPLLKGEKFQARETAFVHYDPRWGKRVNQYRNQFVRDQDYKLYQDGNFYDLNNDKLEKNPLGFKSQSDNAKKTKTKLEAELQKHPPWN